MEIIELECSDIFMMECNGCWLQVHVMIMVGFEGVLLCAGGGSSRTTVYGFRSLKLKTSLVLTFPSIILPESL